jgi:hypothetical protein
VCRKRRGSLRVTFEEFREGLKNDMLYPWVDDQASA